jgi:DNA-directed RNA polymerase beta subunit
MSNYNVTITQDVFQAIQQLAALVATSGIDDDTNKLANKEIRELISILKPEFQKLSATASGIKLL